LRNNVIKLLEKGLCTGENNLKIGLSLTHLYENLEAFISALPLKVLSFKKNI